MRSYKIVGINAQKQIQANLVDYSDKSAFERIASLARYGMDICDKHKGSAWYEAGQIFLDISNTAKQGKNK